MNNLNLSDDKVNSLLQMAAKKLGTDPTQLKKDLQSGSMDNITKNLDSNASAQLNSMLKNPEAMKTLMNNEQVRNILGNLNTGK